MRNRLRTRARLVMAFLLVAAIGGAMGGAGMYYARALAFQTQRILAETMAPLKQIFGLYSAAAQAQVLARDLFLQTEAGSRDKAISLMNEKDRYVVEETGRLGGQVSDKDLQSSLSSFLQVWQDFRFNFDFLVEDANAGHKGASASSQDIIAKADLALNGVMGSLMEGYIGQAAAMARQSGALARQSSFVLGALIVAGLAISILLGLLLSSSIARSLGLAVATATAIAGGDLTGKLGGLDLERKDEFGDLARALDAMSRGLNTSIGSIYCSVDELGGVGGELAVSMGMATEAVTRVGAEVEEVMGQVIVQGAGVEETAATVREMTKTIEGLDREIEAQNRAVSDSSASVEEMVGNIRSVASSVERLGESFGRLLSASEDGSQKLERVNNLVREISEQSQKLGDANSAVSGIAAKTNLLAMNAAIEAAHAGDSGRGFAVVAAEIRNLAESSSLQSKEISRDISGIKKSIGEVVLGALAARESFTAVLDLMRSVGSLEEEINTALAEQLQASRLVLDGLASIGEVSGRVRSGSQELREGSRAIGTETGELQRATAILKEAAQGISRSMDEIGKATISVSSLSERNGAAIAAVESLLGQYLLDSEKAEAGAA